MKNNDVYTKWRLGVKVKGTKFWINIISIWSIKIHHNTRKSTFDDNTFGDNILSSPLIYYRRQIVVTNNKSWRQLSMRNFYCYKIRQQQHVVVVAFGGKKNSLSNLDTENLGRRGEGQTCSRRCKFSPTKLFGRTKLGLITTDDIFASATTPLIRFL